MPLITEPPHLLESREVKDETQWRDLLRLSALQFADSTARPRQGSAGRQGLPPLLLEEDVCHHHHPSPMEEGKQWRTQTERLTASIKYFVATQTGGSGTSSGVGNVSEMNEISSVHTTIPSLFAHFRFGKPCQNFPLFLYVRLDKTIMASPKPRRRGKNYRPTLIKSASLGMERN